MTDTRHTTVTAIDVPRRGRKWRTGAIVRNGAGGALYRVTGAPRHYHEDCLANQRVARVRDLPESEVRLQRLLAIIHEVTSCGSHTPLSRGARFDGSDAECPPMPDRASWTERRSVDSYASWPSLDVAGDVLCYRQPNYDDSPSVQWLRDAALADEARALIATRPSLTEYPSIHVQTIVQTI